MNILKGKLNKRAMARFAGVEIGEVDKSLKLLSELGYLQYEKIRNGRYKFILFPEPVNVRELKINAGH